MGRPRGNCSEDSSSSSSDECSDENPPWTQDGYASSDEPSLVSVTSSRSSSPAPSIGEEHQVRSIKYVQGFIFKSREEYRESRCKVTGEDPFKTKGTLNKKPHFKRKPASRKLERNGKIKPKPAKRISSESKEPLTMVCLDTRIPLKEQIRLVSDAKGLTGDCELRDAFVSLDSCWKYGLQYQLWNRKQRDLLTAGLESSWSIVSSSNGKLKLRNASTRKRGRPRKTAVREIFSPAPVGQSKYIKPSSLGCLSSENPGSSSSSALSRCSLFNPLRTRTADKIVGTRWTLNRGVTSPSKKTSSTRPLTLKSLKKDDIFTPKESVALAQICEWKRVKSKEELERIQKFLLEANSGRN